MSRWLYRMFRRQILARGYGASRATVLKAAPVKGRVYFWFIEGRLYRL